MKLYFSPGACSLSPHIVAQELGIPLTLEKVDTATKKVVADGSDYWAINPKGYVPALQLDDGELLTEGPAIVQYLADQKPDVGLIPANGTFQRQLGADHVFLVLGAPGHAPGLYDKARRVRNNRLFKADL